MTISLTLIRRAARDPAAFATIYEQYVDRIHGYVMHRVVDQATAEDITAGVFERVLRKLHTFQPDKASFNTWLFTIARNTVYDHLRQQRRRQFLSLDMLANSPGSHPPPEQTAIRNEERDALLDALARLPERERELIALKFNARLTNREIASVTGLSESYVGTILYRAMQTLRAELDQGERS